MILKTTCAMLAAAAVCAATPASAACQKLAFLVNDYGKDGPTKDAKSLLDKYIVTWTKEKGIANYTVGKYQREFHEIRGRENRRLDYWSVDRDDRMSSS